METTALRGALTVDDLPADGPRHELIDGGLYVTPDAGVRHQVVLAAVERELARHAGGAVVLPGVNVSSGAGTLVIPDVVVVTPAAVDRGGVSVAPSDVLLVVEVESPSTRRRDRTLKRELYAEWGIPYYLVDPDAGTVTSYADPPLPLAADAVFGD